MSPTPVKPPALRPGDTIGIVSPSWFGGESFVPRAMHGISMLESLGYRVLTAPHAFNNHGHVSDTAQNRVADLHEMFTNPDVRAVLCTIGGDHANQLLPLIDWDLIRANPKIFMGFSDITVLNVAIWAQTGLVTFNGPGLLTDWAEYPLMPALSQDSAQRILARPVPFGALPAAAEWTEEFLDWEAHEDRTRQRAYTPSEGWLWLHEGVAAGPLVGGCLESLEHLRGTPYWPDLRGAILFLETSEACQGPEAVDAMLMDYENMGVFDQIAGLLVARPYGMDAADRERFWTVVEQRTCHLDVPVVGNLDIGHTTPLLTLPIGVTAQIDAASRQVRIIESAVIERKTSPDSP